MNRESELGQFGTFDVENYGDLLYPVLLEKMLNGRGVTGGLRKFSLRGGELLQGSGYSARPIQELFREPPGEKTSLIIGGGDLLRTDSLRMAAHYTSISERGPEPAVPFSWQRTFRRLSGKRETLELQFYYRYMDYPAPGPFIIDPGKIPGFKAVAYCSVGAPFEFEEKSRKQVAAAMNKASFVHVRDRQSGKKLADAGVTREIHVAPDLAVMIGELFDAATERAKGRRLLEAQGVDIRRKILCVHSVAQPPERTAELIRELQERKARSQCEIVLLPLGFCHGDDAFLDQLAKDSQGAFHFVKRQSIFEMMSVIAASDLFLGTSLHGNITAFAFGIPHVIGPIPVDKCAGFLDVVGLPAELKAGSWTQAGVKLDMAAGLGGTFFRERAVAARKRVSETVDLLVKAVS